MISIHAPAKGATKQVWDNFCTWVISIHAPAKGATIKQQQTRKKMRDFNPRSREGSDLFVVIFP